MSLTEIGQAVWPEMWTKHDAEVRPYITKTRGISFVKSLMSLVFMGIVILGPLGLAWQNSLIEDGWQGYLGWLFYFAPLAVLLKAVGFPLDYLGYKVERAYNLSKQDLPSWLKDQAKGIALGAVLGAFALALIYLSVQLSPRFWWALCATFFMLFSIVLAQLAPVVLIPLFFKMEPMKEGSLKTRLLELCKSFNIDVKEVYHLGLGEKTEKGNAAFVGLGKTKKIIIGDTLYEKFPEEQVEAVFAHELGHQVNNDLWRGIALGAFFLYLTFFLADGIWTRILGPKMGSELNAPFSILLIFFVLSVLQMPLGVVQSAFSRARERAADRFASHTMNRARPLADALEKLTFQNRSQFKPNKILEFLFYSHPAPWRRILGLRQN